MKPGAAPPAGALGRGAVLGLAAMALAVLVIANDFTALSVALPAMQAALGADVTTVQWVISGYALVFGVLIVTGGRLAVALAAAYAGFPRDQAGIADARAEAARLAAENAARRPP